MRLIVTLACLSHVLVIYNYAYTIAPARLAVDSCRVTHMIK